MSSRCPMFSCPNRAAAAALRAVDRVLDEWEIHFSETDHSEWDQGAAQVFSEVSIAMRKALEGTDFS